MREETERVASPPPEGEELYRYLFMRSPLPMWVADRATLEFLDVNLAAQQFYGYSREEFLRMTVGDLRPFDATGEVVEDYRWLSDSAPNQLERRHIRKDGTSLQVLITANTLEYEGRAANLVQIVDLTALRGTEQEMLARQERFSKFLDSSLDAVIGINGEGVIVDWGGSSEATFGYTEEEAKGRTLADLIIPDQYRVMHRAGLERYRRSGEARVLGQRLNLTGLRRDGSEFPVELEIADISTGDEMVFGAFIRDLTEQQRAEAEIRQLAEDLERRVEERTIQLAAANEELQGFTYTVSHDLRAPLRAIMSTSMILLEDYGPSLPEEARQQLRRQADNAKGLATLVDELLRFSRLARQELEVSTVDLSALAGEVAEPFRSESLTIEISPGMTARGDATLLKLVLANLIDNAAKFSPAGGKILVGQQSDSFFVRDEGVGFDPAHSAKLFQPFERLVRDDEFPGTGIGLANVHRIIGRHGGKVWAVGELGRGATFFFSLPR